MKTTQAQDRLHHRSDQACHRKANFVCSNIVSASVMVKMGAGRCEHMSGGNQIQIWWEAKERYFGIGNI